MTSSQQRIYFLGITTAGSAVRKVFPAWMELLGVNATLEPLDIPGGAPAPPYREFLTTLLGDDRCLGAVITAHKTAVFRHAGDLLGGIEPLARHFEEVSVLFHGADGLTGTVIEQDSIATTLERMGGGTPIVRPDADIVVFGAGGTAISLIACLTSPTWEHQPRVLHLVDLSAERLQHAREIATRAARPLVVQTHHTTGDGSLSDVGRLPPGTLIVNATGLGKDRPGAPFALPAPWPQRAHAWDLNYRGELLMLDAARRAPAELGVTAHDGWHLFVNGWAESLVRIIGREISAAELEEMDVVASRVRGT